MAITLASDLKIYHEYMDLGFTETIMQQVDAFNRMSAGTLILNDLRHDGAYKYESFFKEMTSLTTRRDLTSTAAVTPIKITQDEFVSVKLSRKQGPVEATIGAFKRKGLSDQEFSLRVGQQAAVAVLQEYLDTALLALVAATKNVAAMVHDAKDGTMQMADFTYGLQKYGDRTGAVQALVMHSKVFYDTFRDQLANFKIENVAGVQIATGNLPGIFGKPFIITDSASLITTDGITSGTDSYNTLFLTPAATEVSESQTPTVAIETITGKEQITVVWQFEFDFTLGLKGYRWDTANGGENPSDSALSTGGNWDKAVTDNKNLAASLAESK